MHSSGAVPSVVAGYHRLSELKTPEMPFSKFWRLEVRGQGAHTGGREALLDLRLLILPPRGRKDGGAPWGLSEGH